VRARETTANAPTSTTVSTMLNVTLPQGRAVRRGEIEKAPIR